MSGANRVRGRRLAHKCFQKQSITSIKSLRKIRTAAFGNPLNRRSGRSGRCRKQDFAQPGLPEPPGRVEVFREYGAAGLIFDVAGRLLACERGPQGDRPGITRTDVKTGEVEWLADR